jgi:hypothetical protein
MSIFQRKKYDLGSWICKNYRALVVWICTLFNFLAVSRVVMRLNPISVTLLQLAASRDILHQTWKHVWLLYWQQTSCTINTGVCSSILCLFLPLFLGTFFNTFSLWSSVTARNHVPQPYGEKGRLFYCVSFTQQRRKGITFLPRSLMRSRCGLFMRQELNPTAYFRCMKLKCLCDRTSLQRFILMFIACQDEHEYETWSLTLREERRLREFENRMLRKIFGHEGRRTRGIEEIGQRASWLVFLTKCYSGDQINTNEMGGARGTHGGEKFMQGFGGETWRKRRIILKPILRNRFGGRRLDWCSSG